MLTDWDRKIIADMRDCIARIEKAIAGQPETALVRPVCGDAPLKPVSSWRQDIALNERWIAEIEQGAQQ